MSIHCQYTEHVEVIESGSHIADEDYLDEAGLVEYQEGQPDLPAQHQDLQPGTIPTHNHVASL